MAAEHGFLRAILPASWFEAVRAGTRQWLIECPCGHKRDLWDAGGTASVPKLPGVRQGDMAQGPQEDRGRTAERADGR